VECEHLNEQLGAQNDDFRAKYKKARVEITNLRNENAILKTKLSVYEEDSGVIPVLLFPSMILIFICSSGDDCPPS
jgi:hypothetical protein